MQFLNLLVVLAGVTACDSEGDRAMPASHGQAPDLQGARPTDPPANSPPGASAILGTEVDAGARRGYGPRDIRLAPCATLASDRVIQGTNCPTGFVVFGPYATVPGNADIEFAFEVEAVSPIGVSTDIVSGMGTQFHARLAEQAFAPGTRRWINYTVRTDSPVTMLETRINVRGDSPASFRINDLVITVR